MSSRALALFALLLTVGCQPAVVKTVNSDGGISYTFGSGLELDGGDVEVDYGTTSGTVVEGNDPRLSDARPPNPGSPYYVQNSTPQTAGLVTVAVPIVLDAHVDNVTSPPIFLAQDTATGSVPWDKVKVFGLDAAGGLVAVSQLGVGQIPATGAGWRMMWHPYKAAFRAGGLDGAGDQWNDANVGFYSWAGGHNAKATAFGSFAFGDGCTASGTDSLCFGNAFTASGTIGVSAGASNLASGFGSITLGFTDTATGQGSVAIGYRCTADADYSTAMGQRADANGHSGTFIWSDAADTNPVLATANNQFMARAAGGFRFRTNVTLTTGCDLPAGSGVFSCASDRNLKRDFRAVNGEELLQKISGMPVDSWRYNDEPGAVRHLGPVAQDFRAAFGLGTDEKTIGLLDIDGVNMAAIKALEKRTSELRQKTEEVDTLRTEVAALKASLRRIEASLAARPRP